jgi:GxxExxY protein
MKRLTQQYIDTLSYKIIGAAIEVHRILGPGLLESVYERCMIRELELMGLKVESQQTISINYKGLELDAALRYDLLVEECIVVELKAILEMHPIFDAKAMTYANLLKVPKSFVINFTCTNIWYEGQKSFVNKYYEALPKK